MCLTWKVLSVWKCLQQCFVWYTWNLFLKLDQAKSSFKKCKDYGTFTLYMKGSWKKSKYFGKVVIIWCVYYSHVRQNWIKMHLSEPWCSFPLVRAVTSLLPDQAGGNKDYSLSQIKCFENKEPPSLDVVSPWLLFSRPLNTIMEKSCSDESIICYSTHFTTLLILSIGHYNKQATSIKNCYMRITQNKRRNFSICYKWGSGP